MDSKYISSEQSSLQPSPQVPPHHSAPGQPRSSKLPPSGMQTNSPLKSSSPSKLRYKLARPLQPTAGGAKGPPQNTSTGVSPLLQTGQNQMSQFNLMGPVATTISPNATQENLGPAGNLKSALNPRLRSPNPVSSTAKVNLLNPNYNMNSATIAQDESFQRSNTMDGQTTKTTAVSTNTQGQVFQHTHRKNFRSGERTQPNTGPVAGDSNTTIGSGLQGQGYTNQHQQYNTQPQVLLPPNDVQSPGMILKSVQHLQLMQREEFTVEQLNMHSGLGNNQISRGAANQAAHSGPLLQSRQARILKSRSPPQSQSLLPMITQTMNDYLQAAGSIQSSNRPPQQNSNSMNRGALGGQSPSPGTTHLLNPNFQRNGAQIVGTLNSSHHRSGSGQPMASGIRADSCEHTINNTNFSLVNLAKQNNMQNAHARNQSSEIQSGQVLSTVGSRTGILTKTGMKAVCSPFSLLQNGIKVQGQNFVGLPARYGADGHESQRIPDTTGYESKTHNLTRDSLGSKRNSQDQGFKDYEQNNLAPMNLARLLGEELHSGSAGSPYQSDGDENGLTKNKSYLDGLFRGSSQERKASCATQNEPIKIQDATQSDGDDDKVKGSVTRDMSGHHSSLAQLPKIKQHGEKRTPAVVGQSTKKTKEAPKGENGQPFDFKYIKILIKKGSSEKEVKEVYLERDWVQRHNNIPHFANVIKSVDATEGVEITMNCNADAFNWIVDFVRVKSKGDDRLDELEKSREFVSLLAKDEIKDATESDLYDKMDGIDNHNCLNILVTAYFLQLGWVYNKVWDYYFSRNFSEVVNSCKISLSNINQAIVRDIAERIPEIQLEKLEERKDKFISNIYKARIDQKIIAQKPFGAPGPPGAPGDDNRDIQENASEYIHLYWCKTCQRLLTKHQAHTISCIDQKKQGDEGVKNPMSGRPQSAGFDFNPLEVSSEPVSPQPEEMTSEHTVTNTEQQDALISADGNMFIYHDIIFPEEVAFLAEDQLALIGREDMKEVCSSEPVALENFVKFFREKYRLCWKEIYLKFLSVISKPNWCKNCREWFQMSEVAGCQAQIDEKVIGDNTLDLKTKYADLQFHSIEFDKFGNPNSNGLTEDDFRIFKNQIQVVDSLTFGSDKEEAVTLSSSRDTNKKKFDHIDDIILIRQNENADFVEPQSMNYNVKINQAFVEFKKGKAEKETKPHGHKAGVKSTPEIKVTSSLDFFSKEGQKIETIEQQADDILLRAPKAHDKIQRKLRNQKFMSKLQKECETYVLNNPEQFQQSESKQNKIDYVNNAIIEGKAKRKGQLDSHQVVAVQELVIKRFRRTKKDILYNDDDYCFRVLTNLLLQMRDDEDTGDQTRSKTARLLQSNSKNKLNNQRRQSPAGNVHRAGQSSQDRRGASPAGGANKSDNVKIYNFGQGGSCDLSSQAGIKIYSDIKQIASTGKKPQTKKAPPSMTSNTSGGAFRKGLTKNVARSQGARSNSNQHTSTNQGTPVATISPILTSDPKAQDNQNNRSNIKSTNSASRAQVSINPINITSAALQPRLGQNNYHLSSQDMSRHTGSNQDLRVADQQQQQQVSHQQFRTQGRFMRSPAPPQNQSVEYGLGNLLTVGGAPTQAPQTQVNTSRNSPGMLQLGLPPASLQNQNTNNMLSIQNMGGPGVPRVNRSPVPRNQPAQVDSRTQGAQKQQNQQNQYQLQIQKQN